MLQIVFSDRIACPFVVLAAASDEFHFIAFGQVIEVAAEILLRLATTWRFEVHDAVHPWVNDRDILCTAGLDQDAFAYITKSCHQRQHILLQERFTTCDLHHRYIVTEHFGFDVVKGLFTTFKKGVFGIAVGAAQIAKRESYKHARPASPGTLALNGGVDFIDGEGRGLAFCDRRAAHHALRSVGASLERASCVDPLVGLGNLPPSWLTKRLPQRPQESTPPNMDV